ncbi:MAG: Mur ligase domain-containing protein [Firmicutes bacterium]|nr:Mur ligase domain-containing protein [Bacillota bacterium]
MINLDNVKHIHITAICGTAMGALAAMLQDKGFKVTGSDDSVYPPMSTYLESRGIHIMQGFKPENLDVNPDLVIIGNTVKKVNPEAIEIMHRGLPYMHLPQAMSEFFLKERHPIVIAGTHGKTTTTGLCTWVLESAGHNPGFLVGGISKNFNTNSRVSEGRHFVIEGDEYDSAYFDKVPKFYYYRPATAAITSVEFDHGDIYRDIDHVKEAFTNFTALIPKEGFLAVCADYPHALDVIKDAKCEVVTYGYSDEAQVKIENLRLDESGSFFTLMKDGKELCSFHTNMWGRHNAANAAATALICLKHGLTTEEIQKGFDTFGGVKRRQEIIEVIDDIIIIDDFAHHPTKVRETVKAVRARYPNRRLISVYEPRTNTSRRNFFQETYPASFDGSDMVLIAPVFNPGQIEEGRAMNEEKLTADINARGINARRCDSVENIVNILGEESKSGDVILIMSNGGFGGIYKLLPEKLKSVRTACKA